jgi:hypothetical protein
MGEKWREVDCPDVVVPWPISALNNLMKSERWKGEQCIRPSLTGSVFGMVSVYHGLSVATAFLVAIGRGAEMSRKGVEYESTQTPSQKGDSIGVALRFCCLGDSV